MGRIKTAQVKRITKQLMAAHAAEFSTDFSKNKDRLPAHRHHVHEDKERGRRLCRAPGEAAAGAERPEEGCP